MKEKRQGDKQPLGKRTGQPVERKRSTPKKMAEKPAINKKTCYSQNYR